MVRSFVILLAILIASVTTRIQNTSERIYTHFNSINLDQKLSGALKIIEVGTIVYEKYLVHADQQKQNK